VNEPEHLDSDHGTGADRVPIDSDHLPARQEGDHVRQISLNRRLARTIPPPRKWRRTGINELICPECRAKIHGISDAFWHLQTAHDQGKGIDLEAWGRELRAELDEFIDAAEGRRGYVDEVKDGNGVNNLAAGLLAVLVLMVVVGIVFIFLSLGGG
jgi:hypothetical protein